MRKQPIVAVGVLAALAGSVHAQPGTDDCGSAQDVSAGGQYAGT